MLVISPHGVLLEHLTGEGPHARDIFLHVFLGEGGHFRHLSAGQAAKTLHTGGGQTAEPAGELTSPDITLWQRCCRRGHPIPGLIAIPACAEKPILNQPMQHLIAGNLGEVPARQLQKILHLVLIQLEALPFHLVKGLKGGEDLKTKRGHDEVSIGSMGSLTGAVRGLILLLLGSHSDFATHRCSDIPGGCQLLSQAGIVLGITDELHKYLT